MVRDRLRPTGHERIDGATEMLPGTIQLSQYLAPTGPLVFNGDRNASQQLADRFFAEAPVAR
jgi:hypothetical protein